MKREFQCQGKTLEVKKAEEKAKDGMGGGRGGMMYCIFEPEHNKNPVLRLI